MVTGAVLALVSVTEPQYPAPQSLVMASVAETPFVVKAALADPAMSDASVGSEGPPAHAPRRATKSAPPVMPSSCRFTIYPSMSTGSTTSR